MAKDKETIEIDPKAAKLKALEAALGKIEKDFGKGTIMKALLEKYNNYALDNSVNDLLFENGLFALFLSS